jgi:hypothetical protein
MLCFRSGGEYHRRVLVGAYAQLMAGAVNQAYEQEDAVISLYTIGVMLAGHVAIQFWQIPLL